MLDETTLTRQETHLRLPMCSAVAMDCQEQGTLTCVPGKLLMLFQVLVNISTKRLVDDSTVGLSKG